MFIGIFLIEIKIQKTLENSSKGSYNKVIWKHFATINHHVFD